MEGRHVVVRVAAERFALPMEAVRQVVVPQPPFARVPRAAGAVRGVMTLRGRVVAVVDLAELVGLPPQRLAAGRGRVVILDRDRRTLGLLVDEVAGIEALRCAEPAAEGLRAGVAPGAGGAVTLLRPEAVAAAAAALFGGP